MKQSLVDKAFKKVDRKLFVPKQYAHLAYSDNPIPLDGGSSISQPSLVAEMIELLELTGKEHVLEIGTASGYSGAILSYCCQKVDTIEINPRLAKTAKARLKALGYGNITVHTGDGALGLPAKAPFDAIVVTAAVEQIPKALIKQLKNGGRIVVPVGGINASDMQELIVGIKKGGKLITKSVNSVRFVPLVRVE
ncbi:MAG: protein-L-isoaspartate(D-aspartate) O-methyltransferase [Patescibacteria group bacterium]|nr:protein-L-isoaspartate(D-aspartate) O-methyltransferase [Patescibacteria group bacterium]